MRYAVRAVAAALVAAAAGLALPAGPAHAAACTTDSGVTVVVDFNQLGGGVQQVCVPDGGGDSGSSLFAAAGFGLKFAQRMPGFVCRVNDVPQSDPCQTTAPSDAFWSLWWSSGSGTWSFASSGVGSLKIPDGGFVAFSWDQTSGTEPPSAGATTPAAPVPAQPTPDQSNGSGGDGGGDGTGRGNGSGTDRPGSPEDPTSSDGGSPSPGDGSSTGPDASPGTGKGQGDMGSKGRDGDAGPEVSPTLPEESAPSGDASDEGSLVADPPVDGGGLPGWVAPGLIALLFSVAGVVLVLRRRQSGT